MTTDVTADPWAKHLGVEFLEVGEGRCRVAARLQPHMVNFQGHPHGAVIFALADIAFGAACNSWGLPAVALTMTVSYLKTAAPGARLIAEARTHRQGRIAGFYDVDVTTEDGAAVATVHAVAHRVSSAAPSAS
ncbi:MAG TPA: PaaI family thioesterase [Terriglobales bacterium]|nr:PaaI family thioesterase [Terriglobales bacterium]